MFVQDKFSFKEVIVRPEKNKLKGKYWLKWNNSLQISKTLLLKAYHEIKDWRHKVIVYWIQKMLHVNFGAIYVIFYNAT